MQFSPFSERCGIFSAYGLQWMGGFLQQLSPSVHSYLRGVFFKKILAKKVFQYHSWQFLVQLFAFLSIETTKTHGLNIYGLPELDNVFLDVWVLGVGIYHDEDQPLTFLTTSSGHVSKPSTHCAGKQVLCSYLHLWCK